MSVSPPPPQITPSVFNLPNQLTTARLVLTIVLLGFIEFDYFLTALVLFLVAVSTDWLDGYLARKYSLVTVVGRIFDPFVDKVIICGTFIFLVAQPNSGVKAWMAVVIVARELLVTALRSFFERQAIDFSAQMSGKLKMVVQCAAAAMSLYYLYYLSYAADPSPAMEWTLVGLVWAAVLITIYSGVGYVVTAARLMRS